MNDASGTVKSFLLRDYIFKKVIIENIFPRIKTTPESEKEQLYLELGAIISAIAIGIFFLVDLAYQVSAIILNLETLGASTMFFGIIFPLTMTLISNFKRIHYVNLKEDNKPITHYVDKYFSKITDFDLIISFMVALLIAMFIFKYS